MFMYMKLAWVACAIFCLNVADAEEEAKVVHYTADTFNKAVELKNHFVMFYAPWCGHCKRLHPIWDQLGEMLNENSDSLVTIAKVDCTVDNDLCAEQDVTGYPTLKFFKLGSSESIKFRGTRDLPSLSSFIIEQLGASASIPVPDDSEVPTSVKGLVELTEANFDTTIKTGNHLVKFYAPWCGHCQKLAPTWDQLAENFENNKDVSIAKVDCTVHRGVCNNNEIKGYPTLLFFKQGEMVEKYSGQRSLQDLEKFVRRQLGVAAPTDAEEPAATTGIPLLNADSFSKGVSQGVSFVKFFAPWCGHCKRLAPTWDELHAKLQNEPNVRLVRVDCTLPDSKDLCNEQEIEGFPTLLVYRDGNKISEYNGSRNVDDMYQFLAKYFQKDEL